ncbi:hypothetical protein H4V99_003240 [Cryobacterium sp. CG_9.6]|nr:hypothetical protein [Cryobacterium sp. CG_9.6]
MRFTLLFSEVFAGTGDVQRRSVGTAERGRCHIRGGQVDAEYLDAGGAVMDDAPGTVDRTLKITVPQTPTQYLRPRTRGITYRMCNRRATATNKRYSPVIRPSAAP